MSKVDCLTAIEKGMVAAQAEKTNPCLKTVGTGGDGGDDREAVPIVPTIEILVGTDDEAR
jgi:hypothetical protein